MLSAIEIDKLNKDRIHNALLFVESAPQVYNQYLQLVNKVINLVNQINIGNYIDRSEIVIDGIVVDETDDSIHSNIALKDLCAFLNINNNEVKND